MLQVHELTKTYSTAAGDLHILNGISFALGAGEAMAIMGPSGSGKSTLLYLLGALDRPTSGEIHLDGVNPFALNETESAAFRNRSIGFVFQDHCLLPQLTVLENVLTPTLVGNAAPEAGARARELLERVGLAARITHRPGELSGGEKQRVAIARALIRSPKLLLCDEPTGNLDRRSGEAVAELLLDLHRETQSILVVVSHSQELASRLPRRFELADGHLLPV